MLRGLVIQRRATYGKSRAGAVRDPKDPHGTESNRKTHFPKNEVAPVPEIQGKAKTTKEKAKPITEK